MPAEKSLICGTSIIPLFGRARLNEQIRVIYLAGPITSAVIRPQRQAIALALVHAKSRVENLERYASTVRTVDITYKDWIGAQKAERLNDRVRDLYARTAADELAVQELNRLAERTAAAERAFHASIREANTVAEILALPDDSSR